MIDAETKLVALLGDPVEHSLSPAMHNAAFCKMGLNMVYLACRVRREELKSALAGLRSLGALGCNITVPHKQAVLDLLDEVADEAKAIGAVNTVIFKGRKAFGYNTDVLAIDEILGSLSPDRKEAFLLGAGGVARASAYALGKRGFKRVWVSNRNKERGVALVKEMNKIFPKRPFEYISWGKVPASSCKLLVNATSLGMSSVPWPEGLLNHLLGPWEFQEVLDLVYIPGSRTQLVEKAKKMGLRHIGGEEVLLRQGVWAFQLFTGMKPEVEVMRRALDLCG